MKCQTFSSANTVMERKRAWEWKWKPFPLFEKIFEKLLILHFVLMGIFLLLTGYVKILKKEKQHKIVEKNLIKRASFSFSNLVSDSEIQRVESTQTWVLQTYTAKYFVQIHQVAQVQLNTHYIQFPFTHLWILRRYSVIFLTKAPVNNSNSSKWNLIYFKSIYILFLTNLTDWW